jgi:hypothetical protein
VFLFYKNYNKENIIEFFRKLHIGYGEEKEAPNLLRNTLIGKKLNNMKTAESARRLYFCIAWNAYVKRKIFSIRNAEILYCQEFPEIKENTQQEFFKQLK